MTYGLRAERRYSQLARHRDRTADAVPLRTAHTHPVLYIWCSVD